jgi:hypothetical protein
MPKVPRDATGARVYRREHVTAIAQSQIQPLERRFRHAAEAEDVELMRQLFSILSYRKLLAGDITGLREMVAAGSADEDTIRASLIWVARAWPPSDLNFAIALRLIAQQCDRLPAEETRAP